MTTTRLNQAERAAWTHVAPTPSQSGEPALGTAEQRLDIIYRRLGGKTRIVIGPNERRWLRDHGWSY